MKKQYIKPSITVVSVDTEGDMLRASDVLDRSNTVEHDKVNMGHIEESHEGNMWAGSKDNTDLWEDDEY